MGGRGGMEERLVPKHGYRAEWIRAKAARGKGIIQKLLLPTNLLYSFWESAGAIRRIQPKVVLGLGGYVAFPGGMMASLLNKPLALHEQNAIAGPDQQGALRHLRQGDAGLFRTRSRARSGPVIRCAAKLVRCHLPSSASRAAMGRCASSWSAAASARKRSTRSCRKRLRCWRKNRGCPPGRRRSTFETLQKNYAAPACKASCLRHRRHGEPLRRSRPRHLPRRCRHGIGTRGGRSGERPRPFPAARSTTTRPQTPGSFPNVGGRAILIQQGDLTPEKLAGLIAVARSFELLDRAR
jgi:hypothetical protein